ncbi:GntR family transcriptional regulator [Panacagrimonas perspica]|uniref:GntR family transcriptional regulator n=1 Tax=Panacagrimonas perspica TaxID=381431 RepID=A0A4S3KB82_9GAMM|nr:PLP-dependent aminotransferase family protein [Panacagrimonas perspica]TDU32753.1 GntR family transcriptional regulator [Panacagrimonas perspica]THD05633.1 GntR family transcriptional regulator [Panacagrimonas perspica]
MATISNRWLAALRASSRPAYIALADAIADDIDAQRLLPEQRLPPLRTLARELDLNFTTVARGYAEAQQRGLIDSRVGQGSFVRTAQVSIAPLAPKVRSQAVVGLVDMTMNMPPEPTDEALLERFRRGFASLDVSDPNALLRYHEFGGAPEDREAGAAWLSERIPGLSPQRVLVCPGIQSGLLALLAVLARPGETICCEAITYPGLKGLASQLGIRLHGLPTDDEGIDPEAFAAVCVLDPPKALYCNPTYLNPTTAVMSRERREAIVEIARRHAVPIIEDDAYGFLPSDSPISLAALAPELTFYVTGFAKHVGAGLRTAYLALPNSRYTARLSSALRTMTVMASPFTVALSTQWINDGTVQAATLAIRNESRARQDIARQVLKRADYVAKPEAFHLWLHIPSPWNRVEFMTHLRHQGVGVVVSDAFTVTAPAPEAVRVCLGGQATREECRHTLEVIEDALEQFPALSARVM